jgi:hypothetical protein
MGRFLFIDGEEELNTYIFEAKGKYEMEEK